MSDFYHRTEVLFQDNLKLLKDSHVTVCGCGGVGSYVVEALVRCGIGEITVIDKDVVDVTNINRQIIALQSTVGKDKIEVCEKRCKDINPNIIFHGIKQCLVSETLDTFIQKTDYIVDAIDMVESKIALIEYAISKNYPVISCMGMGNKQNPLDIRVNDISKTTVCPLAKKVRTRLREKKIDDVKVVYSLENPIKNKESNVLGSCSFVPSTAGLIIASEVVKDIFSAKLDTLSI